MGEKSGSALKYTCHEGPSCRLFRMSEILVFCGFESLEIGGRGYAPFIGAVATHTCLSLEELLRLFKGMARFAFGLNGPLPKRHTWIAAS